MKLSIYGSTGFIGSNFMKFYPKHIAINRENLKPNSKDILYLISTVDNYNIFDDITKDVKVNLELLCKVLNYCKSEDLTFNFISSWFVYGKTKNLPADESQICNPKGFYSITKKCAEDLIISFCNTFNVKYRILRLCNVLGKGDLRASSKKNAITWMINQLKLNKKIDLYNEGRVFRDIMHIRDVCDAINMICNNGAKNEIYNIGSGKPTELRSIIDLAYRYTNSSSQINFISPPPFHTKVQSQDFWMDNTKLKKLGFSQKIPIETTIKELSD